MVTIRDATVEDGPFLREVLALAFNWRTDARGLSVEEIMARPDISHYISDWPRGEDVGVIAAVAGALIGAAWLRYSTEENAGYGFVDSQTPEVTIGVLPEYRGAGVGTRLLEALL